MWLALFGYRRQSFIGALIDVPDWFETLDSIEAKPMMWRDKALARQFVPPRPICAPNKMATLIFMSHIDIKRQIKANMSYIFVFATYKAPCQKKLSSKT
ncbi:MAG: hypothetical protein Q7J21_08755 [Rugosibacter sp.]|nr:hypothetical protein [Rugosibacter sp.]